MIKVEFSKSEIEAIAQLLDLAVKSGGLSSVKAASAIVTKLEFAIAESEAVEAKEE